MADEPAGAAGEGAPGAEGGSEPTGTRESASGHAEEKKFTQAEVDELIQRRLARQKQQLPDVEELQQKAKRLEELENQNKTEAERLQARLDQQTKAVQEASEREKQAIDRANDTLKRAAVISMAAKQGAVDPDDVWRLLDQQKVTVSDDGQVKGAEDAVKALLEAKPHLLATGSKGGGFDGGARETAGAGQQGPSMNDQIRQHAGFGSPSK